MPGEIKASSTLDFASIKDEKALEAFLEEIKKKNISSLMIYNLSQAGALGKVLKLWMESSNLITELNYPEVEDAFLKELVRNKKDPRSGKNLKKIYDMLEKGLQKLTRAQLEKFYSYEFSLLDRVRDEARDEFAKQNALVSDLHILTLRNKLLAYFSCDGNDNDLWQELARAFSNKTHTGDYYDDLREFQFGFSHISSNDASYVQSPANKWIEILGVRFLQAYLNYLNTTAYFYKDAAFPYTHLNLHQRAGWSEVGLSKEHFTCLNDYLGSQKNFFPYKNVFFRLEKETVFADVKENVLTLLKHLNGYHVEELKIDCEHMQISEDDFAEIKAFIKENNIQVKLDFEKDYSHKKQWIEVENVLAQNIRENKQNLQQEEIVSVPAAPAHKIHITNGSRLLHTFAKSNQHASLDVQIAHVNEENEQINEEIDFSEEVDVALEQTDERERLQGIDFDQESTGANLEVMDRKAFVAEWSKYSHNGSTWANDMWSAIFDTDLPNALGGLTKAAAAQLYRFREICAESMDPDNLPDGFLINKSEGKYVLCYNSDFQRKNDSTPLTPVLKKLQNAYSQNMLGDTSQFGMEPGISWRTYYDGTDHRQYERFAALYNPKFHEVELLRHLLAAGNDSNRIIFNCFPLTKLLIHNGKEGVERFLSFLQVVEARWGLENRNTFIKTFLSNTSSYSDAIRPDFQQFIEEPAHQALKKLQNLSERHFNIWLQQAYRRKQSFLPTQFATNVDRFCYFVEQFNQILPNEELPEELLRAPGLLMKQVYLDYFLYILKNSADKSQQLKAISSLTDIKAAHYAMRYEGFQFVSAEMELGYKRNTPLINNHAYRLEEPDLAQLSQKDNLTSDQFAMLCYRFYGSHYSKMGISYPRFVSGLQRILRSDASIQNSHLFTLLCHNGKGKKSIKNVNELVLEIIGLSSVTKTKLIDVITAWHELDFATPTTASELQILAAWMDKNPDKLDELKQKGPALHSNPASVQENAAYLQLMKRLDLYLPGSDLSIMALDIAIPRLLGIWEAVKTSAFAEGDLKAQLKCLSNLVLSAPSLMAKEVAKPLLKAASDVKSLYSNASITKSMSLIAAVGNTEFNPLVFDIVCHYVDTNALPENKNDSDIFIRTLLTRFNDANLKKLVELLERVTPDASLLIQDDFLPMTNARLEQLERDPYEKQAGQLNTISANDLVQIDKALNQLFPEEKDRLQCTKYKHYYRYIHDLHQTKPLSIPGLKKTVSELSYIETQQALAFLEQGIRAEGITPKEKIDLLLQYLAITRSVMYRTTGIMPNCTQMLSCLFAAEADSSLILRIESNEGKSVLDAMHASIYQVTGRTVVVTSASPALSKRDFGEFKTFYRYMGVKVNYLNAKSPADAYQIGAVHYADNGNFQLFLGRTWYDGHYTNHKRALISDEAHEALLMNYQLQHRNVKPRGEGDALISHPAPKLFSLVNKFISNPQNQLASIDDLVNYLYEAGDTAVNKYLTENYQDPNDWPILISSALGARELKYQDNFLLRDKPRREGNRLVKYAFARPLNKENDRLNKNGQYTNLIQQFLHDDLQSQYGEDRNFAIDQEMLCSSTLTSDNLWEHYAMDENGIALGLTATPGSEAQRQELIKRYPGLKIVDFPTHRISKRVDHDKNTPQITNPTLMGDAMVHAQAERIIQLINQGANPIQPRDNKNQPVFIVCENIRDAELLFEIVRGKVGDRAIQLYHSDAYKTCVGDNVQTGTIKKKEVIEQAGLPGQITITTPMLRVGTNIKSADKDEVVLVISAYIASQIDHDQTNRRTARGDQGGETAWVPLHGGNATRIRDTKYQQEFSVRDVNAQLAQIKFTKFVRVVGNINELKEREKSLLASMSESDPQEKQASDRATLQALNLQIKERSGSWVKFLAEIERDWQVRKTESPEVTAETLATYQEAVDRSFNRIFKMTDADNVRNAVVHEPNLPKADLLLLEDHNSNTVYCTLSSNTLEDKAYFEAYQQACTDLLLPWERAISRHIAYNVENEFKASNISSDFFVRFNEVLTAQHHLQPLEWINFHRKQANWFEKDALKDTLLPQLKSIISLYREQSGVADYRIRELTQFEKELDSASGALDLLNKINQSAERAFQQDEKHNQGAWFFKRNYHFSRYQLLMQQLRSLTLTVMPKDQLKAALEMELVDVQRVSDTLDKQFKPNYDSVNTFLEQVSRFFGLNQLNHYMTKILGGRCAFLQSLTTKPHCSNIEVDMKVVETNRNMVDFDEPDDLTNDDDQRILN